MSKDLPGLIRFMEIFPDEDTCWEHLRQARWGNGYECPMCQETEDWLFLKKRKRWHCYTCGHQASVTSQTIMENTKLPLRTWFLAAYLVFTTKKGISSHELARKLEIHQESAWYLTQRLARITRPNARRLFGIVEVDESYIGGKRPGDQRGRSLAKAPVLGAVEAKDESAGDLVLQHVTNAGSNAIDPHLEEHVDKENALVRTDGLNTYYGLADRTGFEHERIAVSRREEDAHELFPWIHIVWGNLKRVLSGVHTKASRAQLQDYLDLYAYRFNHRAQLADGLEKGLRGLVSPVRLTRDQLKGGELAKVY